MWEPKFPGLRVLSGALRDEEVSKGGVLKSGSPKCLRSLTLRENMLGQQPPIKAWDSHLVSVHVCTAT